MPKHQPPRNTQALDLAYSRLEERLRRAADRRHNHHRGHGRNNIARSHDSEGSDSTQFGDGASRVATDDSHSRSSSALDVVGDGPLVVREKTHAASAMTLDQALYEMELVGHDFFLFQDATTGTPSVVYRRKGYDYGVLHLKVDSV